MDAGKKKDGPQIQVDEEYFLQALFDTYRHQYGNCVITEAAEHESQ